MKAIRRATHAGSWYEDEQARLDAQLQGWLDSVDGSAVPSPPASVVDVGLPGWSTSSDTLAMPVTGCKAVISPCVAQRQRRFARA